MRGTRKSITKNAVFNIAYSLLNLLFPFFSYAYIARILHPSGVGKVEYAQNIASYFVAMALSGMGSYGVREIAKVSNSKENLNKTFSELFIVNTITTICALIMYYIVLVVFSRRFSNIHLLYIFSLQVLFNLINVDWYYQGKEEYIYIVIRNLLIKVISIIAIIIFVRSENDIYKYAIILVIAIGGNNVFNIVHLRNEIHIQFNSLELKRHIKPLFILSISVIISQLYGKIDVTMLGNMCAEDIVGYYSYAQKIIHILVTICTSITAVFTPRLAYYYQTDKSAFRELIKNGINAISVFVFPAVVGVAMLSPQIVSIAFGAEYAPSVYTIRLLLPLLFIQGYGNLLCYQLVLCTGNEAKRLPSAIAGSVVNIIANAILIPKLLQNGAAIASVISELIVALIQFRAMYKLIHFSFEHRTILKCFLSSVAMIIPLLFVLEIEMTIWVKFFICVLVGAITYLIVNIITRNRFVTNQIIRILQAIRKTNA